MSHEIRDTTGRMEQMAIEKRLDADGKPAYRVRIATRQPVKVVSERLGHAKVSITLDTYAALLPDMQDRAVEALDTLMAAKQAS